MKPLVSRSRVIAPFVLALVLASPASLRAALIVYEGFNYGLADNAPIGTDFAWQQAAANPAGTAWQYGAASLTVPFDALPAATGGSLQIAGGGQTGFDTPGWGTLTVGTTYWYSFTLNTYGTTAGTPGSYTSSPRGTFNIFSNTNNANNPQNGFGINIANGGALNAGASTGGTAATGTIISSGGVYSILGRLFVDGAGSATNTLWVNPADVSSEVALGTGASVTGSIATNATEAAFGGRSFGGSTGYRVDEIRVGTAFFDVVPEPSSAALGLLGALGLLRRRR
jgi:hypothetical protein